MLVLHRRSNPASGSAFQVSHPVYRLQRSPHPRYACYPAFLALRMHCHCAALLLIVLHIVLFCVLLLTGGFVVNGSIILADRQGKYRPLFSDYAPTSGTRSLTCLHPVCPGFLLEMVASRRCDWLSGVVCVFARAQMDAQRRRSYGWMPRLASALGTHSFIRVRICLACRCPLCAFPLTAFLCCWACV
jgi:hypothetical protein